MTLEMVRGGKENEILKKKRTYTVLYNFENR